MAGRTATLRATISVQGRFHAFHLARELDRQGHLERLITTFPKFETVKYGVPRDRIRSLIGYEVAQRFWRNLPGAVRRACDLEYPIKILFDRHVAALLRPGSEVFVGWSGVSVASIRRARELGMKTFLERGSAHMLSQLEILREEYARHGLPFHEHHPGITERELIEYEEADRICVPSRFVERTFLERGVAPEKLVRNPYGVDLSHFGPGTKSDDVFRVIFCGALSIRKGLGTLLQAFQELDLPNSELWLIGSRQTETEPLLARHARPNIRHLGPFPEFELHRRYIQGSVFCMPSIEEGLAMVQVQAMACGLPLICTTNTGGEDLIEDGKQGFVLPVRDVEALKGALETLYRDPERRAEMGRSARARVEAGFTWADYAGRAAAAYASALEAGS